MDLIFSFVLLGSLWAFVLFALWLPLSFLPPLRQRFPHAYRGTLFLMGFSGLMTAAAGGVLYLYGDTLFTREEASETVTISFSTDPQGASVYFDGLQVGVTPFSTEVPRGASFSYAIIADPLEFHPFAGHYVAERDANLSVWIDRLNGTLSLPADATAANVTVTGDHLNLEHDPAIVGELRNGSSNPFAYALVSFALYDANDQPVAIAYDLLHGLEPFETRPFRAPLPLETIRTYRLLSVRPFNP